MCTCFVPPPLENLLYCTFELLAMTAQRVKLKKKGPSLNVSLAGQAFVRLYHDTTFIFAGGGSFISAGGVWRLTDQPEVCLLNSQSKKRVFQSKKTCT